MTIKYGEFKFKGEHGFTGSAGQKNVKGYMRGGKTGIRKMRSDKGFTQEIPAPKVGMQPKGDMPGTIRTPDVGALSNPTQMNAPSLGQVAKMKMGGRTKRK